MQRFLAKRVNMSRIFRLAQLFEGKYSISIFADDREKLEDAKDIFLECYKNFFVRDDLSTTEMDALQRLKRMDEPFINKLFGDMAYVEENIDDFDAKDFSEAVNDILLHIADVKKVQAIDSYLENQVMKRRIAEQDRYSLYRGVRARLESISKRLDEAKNLAIASLPYEESDSLQKDLADTGLGSSVDFGPTRLSREEINLFFQYDVARRHGISKDNWDKLYTDPTLIPILTKFVRGFLRAPRVAKATYFNQDVLDAVSRTLRPVDIMPRPLKPPTPPKFTFEDEFDEEEE